MNELEILEAWHPTEPAMSVDAEHAAHVALDAALDAAIDAVITPRRPSAGRRFAGRALVAAAVTIALVAGGVVVARRTLDDAADRVGRVRVGSGVLDDPTTTGPMNVLVVGSDS